MTAPANTATTTRASSCPTARAHPRSVQSQHLHGGQRHDGGCNCCTPLTTDRGGGQVDRAQEQPGTGRRHNINDQEAGPQPTAPPSSDRWIVSGVLGTLKKVDNGLDLRREPLVDCPVGDARWRLLDRRGPRIRFHLGWLDRRQRADMADRAIRSFRGGHFAGNRARRKRVYDMLGNNSTEGAQQPITDPYATHLQ